MKILLILMALSFFGYVGFIWLKYGIQPSVSDSFYQLPTNLKWLFTLSVWGYAIPAIIFGLDLTGHWLIFISGTGIAFVGASPAFKSIGMERTVHSIGAIVGITASQVFIGVVLGYWLINIAFILFATIFYCNKRFNKHFIWWLEIAAFAAILISYAKKLSKSENE